MKYSDKNKPLQCFMTQSTCYKGTDKMTVKGVLWHSTGANNPTLKRYVQPDDNAPNRDEMIALIGKNVYGNDWNHIDRQAGLNCWIGKLADGTVTTIQAMPWDFKPWGCGSGKNGSCNNGWVQFEICEDGLTDPVYFEKVYKEACEITAYICQMFGIDPNGTVTMNGVKVPTILCHADSHKLGLGSGHGDVNHWFPKHGKSMATARADVAALLKVVEDKPSAPVETPSETSTEKIIWDFFTGKGLNTFAVGGIMGNLFAESALRPENLQNTYEKKLGMTDLEYTKAVDNGSYTNFVRDSAGYGLAQWTYWSRKQELLEYAQKVGKSIADLGMQLDFMWKELQGYTSVMKTLKAATSVQMASDAILTGYERPANQSDAVKVKRASYGKKYYDKYASPPETPSGVLYRVQVGAFSQKTNADAVLKKLKAAGFDTYMVQVNGLYKVQVGAYSKKSNADAMAAKLKASGFDTYITTKSGTAASAETQKKSVTELAKEVIAGKWGNGSDRKNRLTQAGYDYAVVQAKVNELMK